MAGGLTQPSLVLFSRLLIYFGQDQDEVFIMGQKDNVKYAPLVFIGSAQKDGDSALFFVVWRLYFAIAWV